MIAERPRSEGASCRTNNPIVGVTSSSSAHPQGGRGAEPGGSATSADLPAAVFVVLHIAASGTSVLPAILTRRGDIPAAHAIDGEPVEHRRIYVAPPDHHLLLEEDAVRVVPSGESSSSSPTTRAC
jgi:hypothetical protein